MTIGYKTAGTLGAIAALAGAAPASASVYYTSASVATTSYASANTSTSNGGVSANPAPATSSDASLPLSATSTLTATATKNSGNQARATNTETATASFSNLYGTSITGSANFTGSSSAAILAAGAANNATASGHDSFTFDFSTGGYGQLTYSTLSSSTLNLLSSGQYLLELTNLDTMTTLVSSLLDATTNVAATNVNLASAGNYRLTFEDIANPANTDVASKGSSIGTLNGSRNTTLNFAISAVPEPATWAFMLVGFGIVGFGMRQRKASPALA